MTQTTTQTTRSQVNVYRFGEGWGVDVMLYPGEECSYQDREWKTIGHFSRRVDADAAARRALETMEK